MSFCSKCGREIVGNTKFCPNCGAEVDASGSKETGISTSDEKGINKISKFFGIVLMIFSFVDFVSDPPVLTIIISAAIIGGAIFCLSQKYKLKGFTIVALILAVICLLAGINQGKKQGFMITPESEMVETSSYEETSIEAHEGTKKVADTVKEDIIEEPVEAKKAEEKAEDKAIIDGVDPELKAFLDSYEEFMDEYVGFMKKYMADPGNVVSMLNEYSEILAKYEDFGKKIEEYNSDSMSTVDAAYYLEVVNRCNQKLLEIYAQ